VASLSIGPGKNGRVLLKCHAGCSFERILAAAGLDAKQLRPSRNGAGRHRGGDKPAPKGKSYGTANEALAALDAIMRREGGKRAGKWDYLTAAGEVAALVVRYDLPTTKGKRQKKTFRPVSRHSDGWRLIDPPDLWPLYALADLAAARRVFVVEGEKCADAVAKLGLVATTSAHGAQSPGKTDWAPLAGKEVVVLPDHDEAGRGYAEKVAGILVNLEPPATVRAVDLNFPGRQDHADAVDYIAYHRGRGKTDKAIRRKLEQLADAAEKYRPDPAATAAPGDRPSKQSATDRLVSLVLDSGAHLFHAADQSCFATVPHDNHRETWPLRSAGMRSWVRRLYWAKFRKALCGQAVADAVGCLEGLALHDGPEHEVFVRVAGCGDRIFLDLADAAWQAVEIDATGWRVVGTPPVRFRRAKAMLPLPPPAAGGTLEELRPFINVKDSDWPLILGWLVAALRPTGPYPVLCLHGEQGSAKSTAGRVLRALVDPNTAPVRAEPRDLRDLAIAANNGWVVALDNISYLHPWLSDSLCRLSTGGGFSTRTLYENDEETIFAAQRPAVVNGIEELATRGDLLDRALLVLLPTIPEDKRQTEDQFWRAFERARPRILGALLTAVAAGLRKWPTVQLTGLPRMADFAKWAVACEPALGLNQGSFLRAYRGNVRDANELALESSPVVRYLTELVSDGPWEGTAADLLATLDERAGDGEKRLRIWPKTARVLSGLMRRLSPNLRRAGFAVDFAREGKDRARKIKVSRAGKTPSAPSATGQKPQKPRENAKNRRTMADGRRTV
jgi:hypothetical protein